MHTRLLLLPLLPLALTGCDLLRIKAFVPCPDTGALDSGGGDGGEGCPLYYRDADGDGYGDPMAAAKEFCDGPDEGWVESDDDCDDTEPAVNPGATEICNDGVDDDCDDLVDGKDEDLDLATATAWYPDYDGDGYGDDDDEVLDCEPPVDHTNVPGDCNDSDPDVNPGAAEVCNDQDDDCDTLVDDADDDLDDPDAGQWWPDGDGDGWAIEGDTLAACVAPEGYVSEEYVGDCDDGEPLASPGLDEACDDDIDNDCDGDINEDCASTVYGTYSTDVLGPVFVGAELGDASGWTFSGRGDLDGDLQADLVIGSYRADSTDGGEAGAVYVLPGPWDRDDGRVDLGTDAAATWWGDNPGDNAGVRVSIVGDVDDDGYDDILVGADQVEGSFGDTVGQAYLIHGPAMAGGSLADADSVITGPDEQAYLGRYLGPAGDLDDDGFADLIVGAYGATDIDGLYTQPGVLYIYKGPLESIEDSTTADWAIEGIKDTGRLSISTEGQDLTGDGVADLVFGAHGASQVYVMPGPLPDAFDLGDTWLLAGEADDDSAGFSLAGPGDVDGDGYDDLLVGAYESDKAATDAGAAYLMAGPITGDIGLETASAIFVGDTVDDLAGLAVAAAGDLDDDGRTDIAIAAPWNDEGEDNAGLIAIFYASDDLSGIYPLEVADLRFTGSKTSQFLGYGLDGLGDLDGDGVDDLGLGSWNTGGGETAVYFGGSTPGE